MGYVEETGAAQHYRDIRIAPIYEGTNGIQAADLVGRKLGLEGGAVFAKLLAEMRADAGAPLVALLDAVEDAAAHLASPDTAMDAKLGGSYPFLTMMSVAVSAWLMDRQRAEAERQLETGEGDPLFLSMKIAAARYYLACVVPEAAGLKAAALDGAVVAYTVPAEAFAA
jgi:hypothetical protein